MRSFSYKVSAVGTAQRIILKSEKKMKLAIAATLIGICMQACVSAPKKHVRESVRHESAVISIKSMAEVETFVDDTSLVLFDLDHTVFEGARIYGHANWFYGLINAGKAQGIAESETIRRIFPAWLTSQERTSVKPVEALTPALIARLQARGLNVMGLTARQTPLIPATVRQLSEIGIDFTNSSLMPAIFADGEFSAPVAYRNGILFTSEFVKKSAVLKAYFDRIGYVPQRIIFVDDSRRHVEDLVQAFDAFGVQVIGLHYPLVQERNTPWNQELAEKIFEQCGNAAVDPVPACMHQL